MMTQVSLEETKKFFEILFQNKISEAERILQQLSDKYPNDVRYIHALKGIYLSYVGDDSDSLVHSLYSNEELWRKRKEMAQFFREFSRKWGGEDRYFEAWAYFLNIVDKIPRPAKLKGSSES